jgi:hypothetical protein
LIPRITPTAALGQTDRMNAEEIRSLVDEFNAAWSNHDLDAAIALIADDCLFDGTAPAPDGTAHKGRDAVRAAWAPIFADAAAHFTTEDSFVADDRFVQTWRYDFEGGHIRGVDVIEVRDGAISAKLSYVKG